MEYSRDRYNRHFEQLNASWSYENKQLSHEEKERIYQDLNNVTGLDFNTKNLGNGGRVMKSEYCYPESNVLINHFDIKDQETLDRAERYHTAYRAMEMRFNPGQGAFDMEHLKSIHHRLFQDVYPFSGQLRHVHIGKNNYWFCEPDMIPRLADQVFNKLKADNYLRGLSQDVFAEKAAYYYTEINFMHPFREGNGRSIREFFGEMAKTAGYELNWQEVPTDEYFKAVKLTDNPKETHELANVFRRCLSPIKDNEKELLQWKVPEPPMKLKEVLKLCDGLPTQNSKLQATDLNKYVDMFLMDQTGVSSTIKVKMRGADKIKNIPLEKHPHLSATRKNQMIDQAAAAPTPKMQVSKLVWEQGG
jgi:cell filamentation protein